MIFRYFICSFFFNSFGLIILQDGHSICNDAFPCNASSELASFVLASTGRNWINGLDIRGMNLAALCMNLHFRLGMDPLAVGDPETHHSPVGHDRVRNSHEPGAVDILVALALAPFHTIRKC